MSSQNLCYYFICGHVSLNMFTLKSNLFMKELKKWYIIYLLYNTIYNVKIIKDIERKNLF